MKGDFPLTTVEIKVNLYPKHSKWGATGVFTFDPTQWGEDLLRQLGSWKLVFNKSKFISHFLSSYEI